MKAAGRFLCFLIFLISSFVSSQDDLESLLNPTPTTTPISNTFKSTRIINNHSVELFGKNQLDLRIAHRFGLLNSGLYEMFGLDQAKIRIGLEYGVLEKLMLGFGRSTYNKTIDGYAKYLLVGQKKGSNSIPLTVVAFSNIAINTLEKDVNNSLDENGNQVSYPFLGRLSFCQQILIASKVNRKFSIQFIPTWVHWNMVEVNEQKNQTFILGSAFRYLLSRSVSLNAEYFHRINPSSYDKENFYDSFSVGLDIETGGHVFQLHITNSLPMHESGFLTRTSGNWLDGGIHFGFNISREFNL
ncbi:MAG: hypothetical protein CMD26_03070 [Flavobacteriales bacterium]|nr:hypothetical protein [Flavobacteriales bacterium]|tara:strand:- start:1646 stop:2545 length:900 start_codon:yes stop_codon:yes gene_type:complete